MSEFVDFVEDSSKLERLAFTHELTIEQRKLIPKELVRNYRLQRNTTIVSAALFLVSTLPIFWSLVVFGLQARFIIWMGTFLAWIVRREAERKKKVA